MSYDDRRDLYYVSSTSGGRRHTKTFHQYEDALSALYPGLKTGTAPAPTQDSTLGQWLVWWLAEEVTPSRAASTTYGYRNIVRHHVLPALGDIPLASLTPLHLQTYLSMKLGEGLSPNTVIKHYTLLYTALNKAVGLGLLSANPSLSVTPPRPNPTRYTCYSPQQLRILFQATEGTPLGLAIRLAGLFGPAAQ